jgi:hypothetical protein
LIDSSPSKTPRDPQVRQLRSSTRVADARAIFEQRTSKETPSMPEHPKRPYGRGATNSDSRSFSGLRKGVYSSSSLAKSFSGKPVVSEGASKVTQTDHEELFKPSVGVNVGPVMKVVLQEETSSEGGINSSRRSQIASTSINDAINSEKQPTS